MEIRRNLQAKLCLDIVKCTYLHSYVHMQIWQGRSFYKQNIYKYICVNWSNLPLPKFPNDTKVAKSHQKWPAGPGLAIPASYFSLNEKVTMPASFRSISYTSIIQKNNEMCVILFKSCIWLTNIVILFWPGRS